jgi:sugar phosphate isomerase/epimerase
MEHNERFVYWAGNSMPYSLLERARGAAEAGYTEISSFTGDLHAIDSSGQSLASVRRELDNLGITLNATDPLLDWYPSYDPASPIGVAVEYGGPHLVTTEDDVLRWASELGFEYLTLVAPFDDPSGRHEDPPTSPDAEVVESLGRFADRAAAVGVRPHLEVIPTTKIANLGVALSYVTQVGRPNLGLLIDTYNLGRAGTDPAELDEIPYELIFQLQLADAPRAAVGENYFDDAFTARSWPGHGDLAVAEMVQRIAAKGPLPPTGMEVFNERLHALSPAEAAGESLAELRSFLTGLGIDARVCR